MTEEKINKKSGWKDITFDNPKFRSVIFLKIETGSEAFDYLIERLGLPENTNIAQLMVTGVSYCQSEPKLPICSFCGTENNAHHSAACVDRRNG